MGILVYLGLLDICCCDGWPLTSEGRWKHLSYALWMDEESFVYAEITGSQGFVSP